MSQSEENDFSFIYISFDGIMLNNTLKDLGVSEHNNVFYGYEECIPTCESCIRLSTPGSVYFLAKSAMLFVFANIKQRTRPSKSNKDKQLISDINTYISNNYSDTSLCTDSIAKYFSYSANYISTFFKKETSITITKYINEIRVDRACAFAGSITNVKDIAYMCGFSDPLYFTRVFKQIVKITPKEFIRKKI